MSKISIKPLADRVLVEPSEAETKTSSGIIIPENKKPEGSHWDDLKDNYKKENPDLKLMGDKIIE